MDPRFDDSPIQPVSSAVGEGSAPDSPPSSVGPGAAIAVTFVILLAATLAGLIARTLALQWISPAARAASAGLRASQALSVAYDGPGSVLIGIVPVQLVIGLGPLLASRLEARDFRGSLGISSLGIRAPLLPLVVFASFGLTLAGAAGAVWLAEVGAIPELSGRWIEFARSFRATTFPGQVTMVLAVGLLPGTCEELLFRGYLQRHLLRAWPPAVAILATTLVFGLVHGEPLRILFTIPDGIWLGYVAYRCGSILPGMIAHTAGNAAFQMLLQWAPRSADHVERPGLVEALVITALALSSLLALGFAIRALRRLPPPATGRPEPAVVRSGWM